jgi:hypothetical protein
MSDADYIALLIGRIIIGWGRLDQLLNSEIERLMLPGQPGVWPHELKIIDSFTARLDMWGRFCASMCPNDPAKLIAVTSLVDVIKKEVNLRHDLAHGFATLSKLGRRGIETKRLNVHIHRRKETQKRLAENAKSYEQDNALQFWAEDLNPMYTTWDLEAGVNTISNLETEFRQAAITFHATS